MTEEEIVSKLALTVSHVTSNGDRTCRTACHVSVEKIRAEIAEAEHIDAELINSTAIIIANSYGEYYTDSDLTASELRFSFNLLKDIVPMIKEQINGNLGESDA